MAQFNSTGIFHSFFCYIPSMCWCCVILCYFVSNWLPASSSPIEIFILSARSYTEVHSFFFLCVVWWCVSSLSFVPFIHLCSYARVYKPCTQFRTANSSTTSCPCLCIHIYSNHLHTYTNNELRSVFLSLSAFLLFTLFHPIFKMHSMLTTKLSRPNAIVLLSSNK